MDKAAPAKKFLPALSMNEDGNIQAGGAFDALPHGLHGLRRAKIDVRRG
jgi:hypothetical protein